MAISETLNLMEAVLTVQVYHRGIVMVGHGSNALEPLIHAKNVAVPSMPMQSPSTGIREDAPRQLSKMPAFVEACLKLHRAQINESKPEPHSILAFK